MNQSISISLMLARDSMGEEFEVKDLVEFAEAFSDLDLLGDIAEEVDGSWCV